MKDKTSEPQYSSDMFLLCIFLNVKIAESPSKTPGMGTG